MQLPLRDIRQPRAGKAELGLIQSLVGIAMPYSCTHVRRFGGEIAPHHAKAFDFMARRGR
jgi:hypothetical protein